ncbi:MAG: TetR/AcrR family transcriptional regulator [Deltaproteobacteria bacterium]|nr:TetR/AcrR family transcriptional regulator [Deltaproteobacteria bacterium]
MAKSKNTNKSKSSSQAQSFPPGRIKIAESLKSLLEEKEFGAITTAEIAKVAGVSEALIYKYFKDKRALLYQVLKEYLDQYRMQFELDIKGIKGALNKLRKLVWTHIYVYANNRVLAKLIFLEVRSFPDYYQSETYQWVKKEYSKRLLDIIDEGIRNGEIRDDISPKFIRQVILGGIEHVCLREVIFDQEIFPDELSENLCRLIFEGIERKTAGS